MLQDTKGKSFRQIVHPMRNWPTTSVISSRRRQQQLGTPLIVINLSISDAVVMGTDVKFAGQLLSLFAPATQDEVHGMLLKSAAKSGTLDRLHITLLKHMLYYILLLITATINNSLVQSKVPLCLKKGQY